MIGRLEQTYALLAHEIFPASRAPDFETEVVCFQGEDELREFLPPPLDGLYVKSSPNDLEALPRISLYGGISPRNQLVIAHELTHRFNHVALGSMPVWLNEGLAGYYSTIRGTVDAPVVGELDPDNGYASGSVWSRPNDVVFQGTALEISRLPKASTLMRLDPRHFYGVLRLDRAPSSAAELETARHYATAWALVHMLMRGPSSPHGDRFRGALQTLKPGENLGTAFKVAFDDVDPTALDRDFDAYLRAPLPWRQHHPKEAPVPRELTQRPLTEAQVLTLWARLDLFTGPRAELVKRRLLKAVEVAPDDAQALFWLGRYHMLHREPQAAQQRFQAAQRLAPDDAAIQLGLALLYQHAGTHLPPLPDSDRLLADTMRRLAEVAQTASELNVLAVYLLLGKRPEDAARFAAQACARAPDCWQCFHNHAVIRLELGDPAAAAALEETARARLSENGSQAQLRQVEAALELYQNRTAQNPPNQAAGKTQVMLLLPE